MSDQQLTRRRAQPGTTQPESRRLPGRPVEIDGRRVQVYLDAVSLAVAATLGNGNVSAGVRAALTEAQKKFAKNS